MKILHISNFVQKHNGRLFWNHAFKITNGFIRNGHSVYLFSHRDVSRLNISNKIFNENKTQKNLLETFNNYDPDIIVIGHADRISNGTLNEMKAIKKNLKIIEWNVDNYLLDNTENKLKNRTEVVDGFFITNGDEVISSAAINNTFIAFIPNIFDKSIEDKKIFENNSYTKDIFFELSHGVGSGRLKKNKSQLSNIPSLHREKTMNFIINKLPYLKHNFFGIDNREPIWGSEFLRELSKSPMSLNLSREPNLRYYSSDRISQYLGNGSAIFINSKNNLEELFNHKEAIYYESDDELVIKIHQLIKQPSLIKEIAYNGWKRGHKDYNERIVCKFMLDTTLEPNNTINYPWPKVLY